MEKIEYRYLPLDTVELRTETADDGTRSISWYPAVFDAWSSDLGAFRERIGRRAFTKTLQEQDIRALFNHNPDMVLGRNKADTLTLKTDITGLRATVTPPDTQWANDLLVSIDRGDISAGSFGFQVVRDDWSEAEDGMLQRELKEVKLFDVSIVTYPAYPSTDGSVGLRTAFDGISLESVAPTMLRARAGLPLTPEHRQAVMAVIQQLEGVLPEPPAPEVPHSVRAAQRRRQLELLKLKGGII